MNARNDKILILNKFYEKYKTPLLPRHNKMDGNQKEVHVKVKVITPEFEKQENKPLYLFEKYKNYTNDFYGVYHYNGFINCDVDSIEDENGAHVEKSYENFHRIVKTDLIPYLLKHGDFEDALLTQEDLEKLIHPSSSGKSCHIYFKDVPFKSLMHRHKIYFKTDFYRYKIDFLSENNPGSMPKWTALHENAVASLLKINLPPLPSVFKKFIDENKNKVQEIQENNTKGPSYLSQGTKNLVEFGFNLLKKEKPSFRDYEREGIRNFVYAFNAYIVDIISYEEMQDFLMDLFSSLEDFNRDMTMAQLKSILKVGNRNQSPISIITFFEKNLSPISYLEFDEYLKKDIQVLKDFIGFTDIDEESLINNDYFIEFIKSMKVQDLESLKIIDHIEKKYPIFYGVYKDIFEIILSNVRTERKENIALTLTFIVFCMFLQRNVKFNFEGWQTQQATNIYIGYLGVSQSGKSVVESFILKAISFLEDKGLCGMIDNIQSGVALQEHLLEIVNRSSFYYSREGLNSRSINEFLSFNETSSSFSITPSLIHLFNNSDFAGYNSKSSGKMPKFGNISFSLIFSGQPGRLPIFEKSSGASARVFWIVHDFFPFSKLKNATYSLTDANNFTQKDIVFTNNNIEGIRNETIENNIKAVFTRIYDLVNEDSRLCVFGENSSISQYQYIENDLKSREYKETTDEKGKVKRTKREDYEIKLEKAKVDLSYCCKICYMKMENGKDTHSFTDSVNKYMIDAPYFMSRVCDYATKFMCACCFETKNKSDFIKVDTKLYVLLKDFLAHSFIQAKALSEISNGGTLETPALTKEEKYEHSLNKSSLYEKKILFIKNLLKGNQTKTFSLKNDIMNKSRLFKTSGGTKECRAFLNENCLDWIEWIENSKYPQTSFRMRKEAVL